MIKTYKVAGTNFYYLDQHGNVIDVGDIMELGVDPATREVESQPFINLQHIKKLAGKLTTGQIELKIPLSKEHYNNLLHSFNNDVELNICIALSNDVDTPRFISCEWQASRDLFTCTAVVSAIPADFSETLVATPVTFEIKSETNLTGA